MAGSGHGQAASAAAGHPPVSSAVYELGHDPVTDPGSGVTVRSLPPGLPNDSRVKHKRRRPGSALGQTGFASRLYLGLARGSFPSL